MQQKQGIKPSNQKVNPKGKYNDKRWVKLGRREILDIDQIDRALYNDMSISNIYKSTDNMYERTKPPKNEQEQ